MDKYSRNKYESESDYIHRICQCKDVLGWTWQDVADLLNTELNWQLSKDAYRMRDRNYRPSEGSQIEQLSIFAEEEARAKETETGLDDLLLELKKERIKIADERSQNTALIRRMSREETLIEIASNAAKTVGQNIVLPKYHSSNKFNDSNEEGILLLGDWHYGIEIDNYFNVYDPEIAKNRIIKLRDSVIDYIRQNSLSELHVVNLGDLISGRIHTSIRINNRIDVVTQAIQVGELLAEFLNDISEYVPICYYDTLDNHSRLEPNLKESLDLESLSRVINEFVRLRLINNNNVTLVENEYSDDMITFESNGHEICAVHGDKDKPTKVIDNLTMMAERHFDLICTAHLHHWNGDEKNFTRRIGNGSLMGTDDFAQSLRLTSKPSQTLIITNEDTATKAIYIIDLE